MTNPKPSNAPLVGPHGLMPVLTDWWSELNWPRILASARLGLRPGRLGLAFFAIVVAVLLINLGLAIDARLVKQGVDWPAWPWGPRAGAREQLLPLWRAFVTVPKRMVVGIPVTTIVIGPVLLAVWVTMLGAISRISASELTQGQSPTWNEGLRFTVPRVRSLFGAVVGPLVIAWVIVAALVLGGWVLMHLPGLNLVGGLVYGLDLIGGFLVAITLVGYVFGHNLFIPAVVCEGTDAIDAIQRGYTYFFARPARLVFYMACGAVGLVIAVGVVALLARWTIGIAAEGASVWAGDDGGKMVWRGTYDAIPSIPCLFGTGYTPLSTPEKTWGWGAAMIRFWTSIPVILVLAAWLSCGMSVCTAVYLGMRRVCDGQDWSELWMPGMIAGTMAQSLEGRARVSQEMGTPRSAGPVPEADEE